MAVELERSYVFSHESIPYILKLMGTNTHRTWGHV